MTRSKRNSDLDAGCNYDRFDSINGKHPLKKACDDAFIEYGARHRKGGKVAAFNFPLAKEMGLIPKGHPEELTPELEAKILETFSLVIINEYDEINKIKFPKDEILPNKYMATRYLQLQHPNKQGKTSGDGRSIWNGMISHKGKSWDVSSCGTGATALSPATAIQKKFFQSGDPSISYGCGYSELDEGLSTLFFSEIFHKNGIDTERVLGIIDYGNNISINIRAHQNLLRPSHLFNHLKQNNLEALENLVNYYIDRQVKNGVWENIPKTKNARYQYFLEREVEVFAKMAATLEDEYIFCWLDWDGDNVLMDGSMIDFGSIRQFGLFHCEYRYDDDDRFSTSIVEQKNKARNTVQTFAQLVNYLITGEKESLKKFKDSKATLKFDSLFQDHKLKNLVYKLGFQAPTAELLFKNARAEIEALLDPFSYFERCKSKEGLKKVADGINWNAIYCMRDILRELPQLYLSRQTSIERSEFIEIIKSYYATEEDLQSNTYRDKKIDSFQESYWNLVNKASTLSKLPVEDVLLNMTMRSSVINKIDRVTGDSISEIVHKVMTAKPKLKADKLFKVLSEFVDYQDLRPESKMSKSDREHSTMVKGMLKIVREYREGL
ncbi:MAG: hypothetical protein ACJAT2_001870 [Bacteriovoracaceae bacterium]|jgi:uncharacterized protein YdiU (UPF0061 family)